MSKFCEKCEKTYYDDEVYCSKCGTKLIYKSSISSYESKLPEGYEYDFYGHQRPSYDSMMQKERERKESWANRW